MDHLTNLLKAIAKKRLYAPGNELKAGITSAGRIVVDIEDDKTAKSLLKQKERFEEIAHQH